MKIALITFAKFLLFYLTFLIGSIFWHPFHLRWFLSHPTLASTRFFVPDGFLLALALYLLFLLVALVRRRLAATAPWTSLALILALALGLWAKFGWATI